MNDTIREFIEGFEANFGHLLIGLVDDRKQTYTKFFKILTSKPKTRYSDCDFKCWLKREELPKNSYAEIDNYIRSFKGFSFVGHLLTFSNKDDLLYDRFEPKHWRANTTPFLHYMGFMQNEKVNPLFDLQIIGVDNYSVINSFSGKSDVELLDWLGATVWRKKMKKDPQAQDGYGDVLNFLKSQRTGPGHKEST